MIGDGAVLEEVNGQSVFRGERVLHCLLFGISSAFIPNQYLNALPHSISKGMSSSSSSSEATF